MRTWTSFPDGTPADGVEAAQITVSVSTYKTGRFVYDPEQRQVRRGGVRRGLHQTATPRSRWR